MSLLDDIATAVVEVGQQPVTDVELDAARSCVVDAVACGLAGSARPSAQRLRQALAHDGEGSCVAIGSTTGLAPGSAIIANAATIRLLDFNDVYSGRNNLHPSETVLPLLLLFAQRDGWSGRELLEGVVRGYRVYVGVGELWEGLLGRGWAPTATLGQPAAAALTGLLEGLGHEQMVQAMAIGTINAPALGVVFRGELSDAKNLVNGFASMSGWQAASLAAGGMTGPRDVLEGPAGFGEQAAGPVEAARLADWMGYGPESAWLKAYPTVFLIHSAIQAALELRDRDDRVTRPAKVEVGVAERVLAVAGRPDRWRPATSEAAQFSLPYCVAWSLVHGHCGLEAFTEDALADERVAAVLDALEAHGDPRWSTYSGATLRVELDDGTILDHEVDAPLGHPSNPLSEAQSRAKFAALVGADHERVLEVCNGLLDAPHLDELFAALSG